MFYTSSNVLRTASLGVMLSLGLPSKFTQVSGIYSVEGLTAELPTDTSCFTTFLSFCWFKTYPFRVESVPFSVATVVVGSAGSSIIYYNTSFSNSSPFRPPNN